MTTKLRVKAALFFVGLGLLLVLGVVGVSLLTQFITAFQQGADPASIFRGHKLIIPELTEARWLPARDPQGATPTQAQREEILSAYWSAWEALSRAYETGDTSDLATYWAGDAYRAATEAVTTSPDTRQTHRHHKLRLMYLSSDGAVVAFEDLAFTLTQTAGDFPSLTLTPTAWVVMTLDNGFWRIRVLTLEWA